MSPRLETETTGHIAGRLGRESTLSYYALEIDATPRARSSLRTTRPSKPRDKRDLKKRRVRCLFSPGRQAPAASSPAMAGANMAGPVAPQGGHVGASTAASPADPHFPCAAVVAFGRDSVASPGDGFMAKACFSAGTDFEECACVGCWGRERKQRRRMQGACMRKSRPKWKVVCLRWRRVFCPPRQNGKAWHGAELLRIRHQRRRPGC